MMLSSSLDIILFSTTSRRFQPAFLVRLVHLLVTPRAPAHYSAEQGRLKEHVLLHTLKNFLKKYIQLWPCLQMKCLSVACSFRSSVLITYIIILYCIILQPETLGRLQHPHIPYKTLGVENGCILYYIIFYYSSLNIKKMKHFSVNVKKNTIIYKLHQSSKYSMYFFIFFFLMAHTAYTILLQVNFLQQIFFAVHCNCH